MIDSPQKQANKTIVGITEVYDSLETKGFEQSDKYPIAWEIVYLKEKATAEFTTQLMEKLRSLPKDKGMILPSDETPIENINCIECVFSSADTFRQVIRDGFEGYNFVDYQENKLLPKQMLVNAASKIMSNKLALAV